MEKIAINFLPLLHKGGTATYASLLLEQFSQLSPATLESFFFIFPEGVNLPKGFQSSTNAVVLPVRNRRQKVLAEQIVIPGLLKSRGIRWLHQLAFSIPYRCRHFQVICTVHDLTFCQYPWSIPLYKKLYYKHNFKRSICHSRYLITDSKTVKKEISKKYEIIPERIKVIPLGVSLRWGDLPSHEVQKELLFNSSVQVKKYFLHVGTLEPRKNIETLLSWWEKWKKEEPNEYQLLLAGNKGWKSRQVLKKIQLTPDSAFLENVSPEKLKTLYLNCLGVLNLSCYEGFGLPVVEGAYYHLPLILSKIPVFEEIRDSSRFMVEDYHSFASLLRACIKKNDVYQELLKVSRYIKKKYDFNASFNELLQWYFECILKK